MPTKRLPRGIGFRTHAALLAAVKVQGSARVTVLLSEPLISQRLKELIGSGPEPDKVGAAFWLVNLPDRGEMSVDFGQWWKHVANEN